jgi:MinD-like ATPase involved in chromosome partitioning or flagellar assembly
VGLLAVASAKGSPGATTTALLLGAVWSRPVVVAECDPHGGDVVARLPAADGGVLDPDRGMLSLAAAGRKTMHADLVLQHTQQVLGGLEVLAGVRTPEQSVGIATQWGQLGPVFASLKGYDVIADCGRIGAGTPQNVVLSAASDLVMVCDTSPSSVVHLRERILALQSQLRPGSASGTRVHVAVVADPRRVQPVREIKDAMERASAEVTEVFHLAWDPKGAGFFNGRIEGRADRTALVRSALPVAARLAADMEPFFAAGDTSAAEAAAPAQWPGWRAPTEDSTVRQATTGPRTAGEGVSS